MKKLVIFVVSSLILWGSCASQQSAKGSHACGSKQQKKAKYNSMKRGTSPGGGMLH
jgi:hypothetical protein